MLSIERGTRIMFFFKIVLLLTWLITLLISLFLFLKMVKTSWDDAIIEIIEIMSSLLTTLTNIFHQPRLLMLLIFVKLSNHRRHRWSIIIIINFNWCPSNKETLIHVMWDCPDATHVWIRYVPSNKMTHFYSFRAGIGYPTTSKKIL